MLNKISAIILSLALLSGNVFAATLYSNDFDGGVVVGAGISTSGFSYGAVEAAAAGYGDWAGNYMVNRSTGNPATISEITFTGLSTHTTVTIDFLLGFLESWDSSGGNNYSPDYLDFYIDGTKVASLTSNNALGSVEYYAGGTELFDDVEINFNSYYDDTLVDMSTASFLTFAHTSSTLTFGIQASGAGWQGGNDEAWGIDKFNVTYDPVPLPAAVWLFGSALAGLFGFSRLKKRSA